MIKLSDISTGVKALSAVVTVIAGAVIWMFATFETSEAAEVKWAQHNQAIACKSVYEMRREIRRYLDQLKHDSALSERDRKWIEQEIEDLRATIKHVDPNGDCG